MSLFLYVIYLFVHCNNLIFIEPFFQFIHDGSKPIFKSKKLSGFFACISCSFRHGSSQSLNETAVFLLQLIKIRKCCLQAHLINITRINSSNQWFKQTVDEFITESSA